MVRTEPARVNRSRSGLSFSGFGVTAEAFSQQQDRSGLLDPGFGFGAFEVGAFAQQQGAGAGTASPAMAGVTKAKQHHPGGSVSSRVFEQTSR